MKTICSIFTLLLLLATGIPAAAQELSLDQLTKLGTLPTDLPLQKMTALLLPPGWTYRGHVNQTDELYWTAGDKVTVGDETLDEAWLSLRPMPNGTMDVLYKTLPGGGAEGLQREVKHLKLANIAVTCLECEGVRYDADSYTISFYSHKKKGYPNIVVLHQAPAQSAPGKGTGTASSSSGN